MTTTTLRNLTIDELDNVSGGSDHVSINTDVEPTIGSRADDSSSSAGGQGGNLAQNADPAGPESYVR